MMGARYRRATRIEQLQAEMNALPPEKLKKYKLWFEKEIAKIERRAVTLESYHHSVHGRAVQLWNAARGRAIDHGRDFTITVEWVEERLARGVCEGSGIELDLRSTRRGCVGPWSPSLDRVDSNLGYTQANTMLVCSMHNFCKNQYSVEDWEAYIRAAVNRLGARLENAA